MAFADQLHERRGHIAHSPSWLPTGGRGDCGYPANITGTRCASPPDFSALGLGRYGARVHREETSIKERRASSPMRL